jgi:hypothetical protein
LLVVAFLVGLGSRLLAESNLDNAFQDPPPDAANAETAHVDPLEQFTVQSGIRFTGSYHVFIGIVAGWEDAPDFSSPGNGFSGSPAVGISANLGFDVRPDPSFRVTGTMGASFPDPASIPSSYANLSAPAISELFCDLTIADTLFIRTGKQIVTWGASRVFPFDNLPSRVPVGFQTATEEYDGSAGIGVKIGIPFGAHSLAVLAQMKHDYLKDPAAPSLSEGGYGILGELVLGRTELSLGGYYERYLRPRAMGILRTSLWGVDLRAALIVAYAEGSGALASWIGNIFWEQPDSRFSIIAEYLYNAEAGQPQVYPAGHALACIAGFRNIVGTGIDAGLQWQHAFLDGSGFVAPGIVFRPMGHVSVTFGLPVYYGVHDGEIAKLNLDPGKRRTAMGLKLEISGEF